MHTRIASSVVLASLLLSTGCASLPAPTGVTATGEPLSVQEESHTYTYRTRERVGEVVSRDSHGHRSSSTIYADRRRVGHYKEWTGYQGTTAVSDDDLFRLAKDQAAIDEIQSSRESGVTLNRIGWVSTLLGVGATGTGIGLAMATADDQHSFYDNPLGVGLTIGGAVLWGVGIYLVTQGAAKAQAKHPLEQRRAEEAVDRYNKSLPAQAEGK